MELIEIFDCYHNLNPLNRIFSSYIRNVSNPKTNLKDWLETNPKIINLFINKVHDWIFHNNKSKSKVEICLNERLIDDLLNDFKRYIFTYKEPVFNQSIDIYKKSYEIFNWLWRILNIFSLGFISTEGYEQSNYFIRNKKLFPPNYFSRDFIYTFLLICNILRIRSPPQSILEIINNLTASLIKQLIISDLHCNPIRYDEFLKTNCVWVIINKMYLNRQNNNFLIQYYKLTQISPESWFPSECIDWKLKESFPNDDMEVKEIPDFHNANIINWKEHYIGFLMCRFLLRCFTPKPIYEILKIKLKQKHTLIYEWMPHPSIVRDSFYEFKNWIEKKESVEYVANKIKYYWFKREKISSILEIPQGINFIIKEFMLYCINFNFTSSEVSVNGTIYNWFSKIDDLINKSEERYNIEENFDNYIKDDIESSEECIQLSCCIP